MAIVQLVKSKHLSLSFVAVQLVLLKLKHQMVCNEKNLISKVIQFAKKRENFRECNQNLCKYSVQTKQGQECYLSNGELPLNKNGRKMLFLKMPLSVTVMNAVWASK